jgi:hypothetical protein
MANHEKYVDIFDGYDETSLEASFGEEDVNYLDELADDNEQRKRIKREKIDGITKYFFIYKDNEKPHFPPDGSNGRQESFRDEDGDNKNLLAEINNNLHITTIYPFFTWVDKSDFLSSKYHPIRQIVFEGYSITDALSDIGSFIVLENQPKVFTKTLVHGLGFKKEYRFIPDTILAHFSSCEKLIISMTRATEISGTSMIISDSDLDGLRRGIDRILDKSRAAAREDREYFVYSELLYGVNPEKFPEIKNPVRKDAIYKILKNSDFVSTKLSDNDKKGLLGIKDNAELGYLSSLRKEFKDLIDKNHNEDVYQKFLEENPLLLTMFSGSPYMQFKNQSYVGGKTFDNSKGQYPDFLFKHKVTNNTFIIEIKRPGSELLENREYRNGTFSASKELSGAISQVVTQKYQLETDIAALIKNADDRNVEAFNVQGLIIIGLLRGFNGKNQEKDRKRSFELFRNNQKNVRIMAYDECLDQLDVFIDVLSGSKL